MNRYVHKLCRSCECVHVFITHPAAHTSIHHVCARWIAVAHTSRIIIKGKGVHKNHTRCATCIAYSYIQVYSLHYRLYYMQADLPAGMIWSSSSRSSKTRANACIIYSTHRRIEEIWSSLGDPDGMSYIQHVHMPREYIIIACILRSKCSGRVTIQPSRKWYLSYCDGGNTLIIHIMATATKSKITGVHEKYRLHLYLHDERQVVPFHLHADTQFFRPLNKVRSLIDLRGICDLQSLIEENTNTLLIALNRWWWRRWCVNAGTGLVELNGCWPASRTKTKYESNILYLYDSKTHFILRCPPAIDTLSTRWYALPFASAALIALTLTTFRNHTHASTQIKSLGKNAKFINCT